LKNFFTAYKAVSNLLREESNERECLEKRPHPSQRDPCGALLLFSKEKEEKSEVAYANDLKPLSLRKRGVLVEVILE